MKEGGRRAGVLFETLWANYSDGWCIASRAFARAMSEAGVDLHMHTWQPQFEDPHEEVLREVGHLVKPVEGGDWDFYCFSCTLHGAHHMIYGLNDLVKYRRPRVFYTMFERQHVEPSLVALMNQLEGVWVPCGANKEELDRAGVKNVIHAPMPYFDDDPHLRLSPPRLEPYVFYWIGRWEPRKAPDNLIRAFMRAFKPSEAHLLLKIGSVPWRGEDFPEPEEVISRELQRGELIVNGWNETTARQAIRVVRGRYTNAEMVNFHAYGDVYCSASRGEGIDLPAYAAKLAGRRVVTTDSGGPRDFLNEDDLLVTKTGEVVADPLYRWGPNATFADYDLDALVAALQRARADNRLPSRLSTDFHYTRVGRALKDWIDGIVARTPPEPRPPRRSSALSHWVLGQDDG